MEQAFAPSGFFVMRTPLLPFDEVLAWGKDGDRERLRARLRATVQRPEIQEAIFLGSPSLHEQIEVWEQDPRGARTARIERALVRYLMRMCGRATPFGLFAGCSVGSLGSKTRLRLAGRDHYRRHTRFDMEYLLTLSENVERDPQVRSKLRFRPNPGLYQTGDRLRYAETRFDGTERTHHLVTVRSTAPLSTVMQASRSGAELAELRERLVSDDVTGQEADAFLDELVEQQILVSDLTPAVTGPEPTTTLVSRLRAAGADLTAARLDDAWRQLSAIDDKPLGTAAEEYQRVIALLQDLPISIDRSRLLQVDMFKPASSATLDPLVTEEIVRAVSLLHRIGRRSSGKLLSRFSEAFEQRFGTAEAPLLEALDPDLGVSLEAADATADASPLLHGLKLTGAPESSSWTEREAYLLRRVQRALARGEREIELSSQDLGALEAKDPLPLPDAFAVIVSIAAESEASLDRGEFTLVMDGLGGPSGAYMMGRFCHAEPELHERVVEHLRAEEALQPNTIFAELVHLPEGRLGNILLRPVLRDYEIPFLGASGAPEDRQLPVSDLRVSVQNGRIRLRSVRLGKDVVPRLTTAHNYAAGQLPVYRFLCALQTDGVMGGATWSWGALENATFLPRVRCGRLILSPMRWRLDRGEIEAITHAGEAGMQAVQRLRTECGLPRFVAFKDHDHELPVDLDNVLSVEAFIPLLKNLESATLIELLAERTGSVVTGPEGRFSHQLIVPFVRRSPPKPAAESGVTAIPTVRSFPPGSEWLYLKLYGPPSAADRLLARHLEPVIRDFFGSGAADRWFFIRYMDPEPHLRLRVHGEGGRLLAEVRPTLEALAGALHREGHLWRVQWDTYEREVERYGGPRGMEIAERVFHVDSEAVVEILSKLWGDAGLDARWRLTLRGMHSLLDVAEFDEAAKLQVMRRAAGSFAREFRADKRLHVQLGDRFRKERKILESLLDPARDAQSDLRPGLEILDRRSQRLRPLFHELRRLETPLADIVLSYLHMFANRLLRSSARAQEMVLYDFLARLYASDVARGAASRRGGVPAGHGS